MNQIQQSNDKLFQQIADLIELSRKRVKTAIDTTMVYTYYHVGQYIVEDEQQGEYRAKYGKNVLSDLSNKLTNRFGKGWSVPQLKIIRQFYIIFSKRINTVYPIEKTNNLSSDSKQSTELVTIVDNFEEKPLFSLSWSHYLILMRIKDSNARSFYEIECAKQDWSIRQLQRQVSSCLYERLALSRNKDEVMRLSREGHTIEKPKDVIKDPLTLEFLGIKPDESYSESKLENTIISKMQKFLLELGKGFLFEARQKRFTFDEEHFFVDLVLYNRLLRCYCLIDLKIDKLTHQDLGQMQMYVNYFDRYVKQESENPTIGILLCKEKKDTLVELTLPKDSNVFASAYELYLPDKQLLQAKVKEWIEEFDENQEIKEEENNNGY